MLLTGLVEQGSGQAGKLFGLPTANMASNGLDKAVRPGVYASRATVAGQTFPALTFIGHAELLEGKPWRVETHLFDYAGEDLLGQTLSLDLLTHLRDPIAFTSVEQAKEIIEGDVRKAREYFA
ncbi:MAG: riboflavin kinase [Parcubacteria group bacterium]|nr:riboflavin kinase [Parcubacteria group bacterium]